MNNERLAANIEKTSYLAGDFMDGLGETFYVGGCDSSYGYSTVFGGVDGML